MPRCVLKTCKNNSVDNKKESGVTFHRFLQPDHENQEKWIRFVQKNRNEETWLPSDYTYICSVHFKDDDKYTTKNGRTYLKKHAIPQDVNGSPSLRPASADSISDTVSDTESIFDAPQICFIKRKLSKVTIARNTLATNFKNLQNRNRYLIKKSYKLMVKNLTLTTNFKKLQNRNRYLIKKCESYKLMVKNIKEKMLKNNIR